MGRGLCHALTALQREGSSTRHRSLHEGPVICSGLDQGMNNARHLGGDGDGCLASQILVLAVFGNMAAEAITEAVVALADGDLGGQPEGSAQTRIAELRQACLSSTLP
jgi:hypothetical protein